MNFIKKLVGVLLLIATKRSVKIDGQTVGCGGTYSNLSGIISSPNYPSNYDDDMDCVYEIQSSPSHSVNITFISFATQSHYDWLQISCTNDSTKAVQRFSGADLPPFLSISSCYNVQLLFHTNGYKVAKGFSLRYDIGNGLQGGLTMKPVNLNVSSDSTEPVVLSCSSRANQPDVYPWWSYRSNDYYNPYVEILTTSKCSVSSPLRSLNSSYFSTTREYSSRTCNLILSRIYFHSLTGTYTCTDSTLDFLNALINYDCGGTYSNLSGIISSLYYPSNYSNNLYCTYYIQSSPPNSVNITFISFATEPHYDWLQVSCTNDSTKPVQRFSGTDLPPFLSISSCYNVQLLFYTNGFEVRQGFSLRYDIGNGMQGGLTMKPMNFVLRHDSTEPVVLSCSSRANHSDVYPWWSYNDYPYVEILTTSNCSVSSSLWSLNSSYLSTTRQYSSRACNLTISRFDFRSSPLIYTCTDSNLDFSKAQITFVDPFFTFMNLISSTEVVRNDTISVACGVQVSQMPSSIPQLVPSIYLYSGDNQNPIVVSNSAASFNLLAPPGILPSYGCDINFTYSSKFSAGYATNKPQGISFMTPSRQVLYWPENKAILIKGDDNGTIVANGNLDCFVPANPPVTYQWAEEKTNRLWKGPTVAVSHNSIYTCTATNIIRGKTYEASKSINITIINDPGNNTMALIVGVVVGIVVLLIVVAIVVFFCLRRKKIPETHPAATTNVQPQNDISYEMNRRSTLNANEGEISAYEMIGVYDTISTYETISTCEEISTYETISTHETINYLSLVYN